MARISWSQNWATTRRTTTTSMLFASRSKAQAKPRRRTPASSSLPIGERKWTDVEPEDYSPVDYPVSEQLSTLLRHGHLLREDDGAIEFWRKESSERFCAISTLVWWNVQDCSCKRRRKQEKISILHWSIKTRNSLPPSSPRSFRKQSHWSYTSGQCVNSEQFHRVHLSHRVCNQFTLHHEFRIDTGRTNFEQKTDGILLVYESNNKDHKDPETIDLKAPRLA